MQQATQQLTAIKLVGITCRTNNAHIFERDPSTNKISATVQKYFHGNLAGKINNRKKPGTTYCVYTEYESDFTGDYTYFIGEEVSTFDDMPNDFSKLIIPVQTYTKFTSAPGAMPEVCVDMWKNIWAMTPEELGGQRGYLADFEVYDERASDHHNVVLDIYIGIKR